MREKTINYETIFFIKAIIVAWLCMASTCAMDYYNPLYLTNNSRQDLRFAFSDDNDTILPIEKIRGVTIKALSTDGIAGGGAKWESVYKVNHPSGIMSLFILSCDTLAKYPWEQVREDYNILVRYDLRLQDLYKLDFKVVYPPSEAMKDMKMYPPYGSK